MYISPGTDPNYLDKESLQLHITIMSHHALEEVVLPPTHPARSNSHILSGMGMVVDPVVGNPAIQNAMQILDQLSDIGRAMPFVAPAFMLLKIIIDVERKAQDVDTKCNDLLERITFMLGHIPILKRIEVNVATQQVILRMNDALKGAAALITAYRKQGFVARRLNLGNREKFITCAESLNTCCKDLMISLQIHQTDKISILTRAIPADGYDEEARTFVSSHGGVDGVTHNRELVEEFARQQHLTIDDTVMEQLNAGLNETIERNQKRLEEVLSSNVDAAIVYGLKGLAAEMNAQEAEQRFTCVQCNKEFRYSTNGPKACSFHRAEHYSGSYSCCGTANPCEFRSHRERHHSDYPYGNFFEYSRNILRYTDTVDWWSSIEDTNLETDAIQKCSIGKLLRWKSKALLLDKPTIIISVGNVWYRDPYFFDTYTVRELQSVAAALSLTGDVLIYRTPHSDSGYAMAEWILSNSGDITGVRLTVKTATSEFPWIRECRFECSASPLKADVRTISEGGYPAYKPSSPYILPPTVRIGPELSEEPLRPVRTDFKSRSSSRFPILLKCSSNPPLSTNKRGISSEADFFSGEISAFNNQPISSQNIVTIASVSASFRLIGDENYSPVHSCEIEQPQLPISIEPSQFSRLKFFIAVLRSKEDAALDIRIGYNAFMARYRPLRIKIVVESIEGEKCSLIMEYVYQPYQLTKRKVDDMAFFYFDNPIIVHRAIITVHEIGLNGGSSGRGFKFNHIFISEITLTKLVYKALKTGDTEVDLIIGQESNNKDIQWDAYALVDLSCRRVYAFKVILYDGKKMDKKRFGCIGYVLCPEYGQVIDTPRNIRYATENAKLPELEPYTVPSFALDDTFDDVGSEGQSPVAAAPNTGIQFGISDELNRRLSSIDNSLSRIATTLELIAEKLGSS
ncbi:hypothetical protein BDQ17DRAFT_756056 [Cyathus striatus]|nr:hypothetical protein BDQ17DRAFT_756056 [Cyathus striatus]